MTREAKRILGINPGTRYLGLAVFHDTELMDWRVKTFTGKWAKEKAEKILEVIGEYINYYDINTIAIKKLHHSRSSKNLNFLVSMLRALAKRQRIQRQSFSVQELEKSFLADVKVNKRNLANRVVVEYPMLGYELNKEKFRKHPYFMRVLEAVALGMKIKTIDLCN